MEIENQGYDERLRLLETLVNELLKDHPDEKLVKSYMERVRLPYVADEFQRINTVLKALHLEGNC